jgi:hypothetical protein
MIFNEKGNCNIYKDYHILLIKVDGFNSCENFKNSSHLKPENFYKKDNKIPKLKKSIRIFMIFR